MKHLLLGLFFLMTTTAIVQATPQFDCPKLTPQEAVELARGLLNAADLNERAKGGF